MSDSDDAFQNLSEDELARLFGDLLRIESSTNSFLHLAWREVQQCMNFSIGNPPSPAPGCYMLWRCVTTLDGTSCTPTKCSFQFPSCSAKWNYFFRRFDGNNCGRFMEVVINVQRSCEKSVYERLIEDGILFGGRKYMFLQGEPLRQGSNIASCKTMFFAECSTNEQPSLSPVSVAEVRASLGRFADTTSPAKLNARLKLGLSSTHAVSFPSSSILVIDDEISPTGAVMTDGCGYISVDAIAHRSFITPKSGNIYIATTSLRKQWCCIR